MKKLPQKLEENLAAAHYKGVPIHCCYSQQILSK